MTKIKDAIVFVFCFLFFELLTAVGERVFGNFVILQTGEQESTITAVIVEGQPVTEPASSKPRLMMTNWHSVN